MRPPRPRNPLIPGTPRDRTGTGAILRRAAAEISLRFAALTRDVLAAFDRIPVYARNDASAVLYGLTPQQMQLLAGELQASLDAYIARNGDDVYRFWWSPYVADASQLGSAQAAANLANLSPAYAATRTLQSIIFSEPYRNRVGIAQTKSYEHWSGQSAQIRAELSQIIGSAVADGRAPREVKALIRDRLDVSESKARAFAQTDITDSLRQARWAEDDAAVDQFGLDLRELWTSALLPTTRTTHAARHGRVYTTQEMREWYTKDGNRYNCFLPGTVVRGRFVAGIKSRYKGPAVRLVTAAGRELSVTANHPVLTARGMVAAAELRKGDQLVTYGAEAEGAFGVGDLDGGLMGARIEDVFSALVESGHQFLARVSAVDLHGDGAFVQPDVDVVLAERPLVFALDATAAQLLDQLQLVLADSPAAGCSSLDELIKGRRLPTQSKVRVSGIGGPILGAELAHAVELPVAPVASCEPCGVHRLDDDASRDSDALAQGVDGLTGVVGRSPLSGGFEMLGLHPCIAPEPVAVQRFHDRGCTRPGGLRDVMEGFAGLASFDELVDLVWSEYEGHVYDLEEMSGLMLGSNIVASNCHCSSTTCLIDASGKPILTDGLKKKMAKEVKDWKPAMPS